MLMKMTPHHKVQLTGSPLRRIEGFVFVARTGPVRALLICWARSVYLAGRTRY
jgi:hypothetical protein